ncbi:MAG: iron-containing alcohol dehydrogenase [Lachnospiraceae bacterium]|nr:iron-containing alcohol dehydrogenase [Lachnospiraceae bacterium]
MLKMARAMICVGGGSMKKFGFLDKAIAYLKEAGMKVELFEGIEPDPSVETVMKGADAMLKFKPDWIIAMGGGSPIDAAIAMWIKYEYPNITFEEMCKVFGIPALRKKARFCAISSTSGTATEVTAFSIITDYAKGIKYPLADFEITPDVAIVDPALVESLPIKQVAYTGMDALTHAIEAYVSTLNSPFTDPLAIKAIEMVFDYLPQSYLCDMDAREEMHYAQCLAGQAFSNALLGIVHSMAHKTGAAFSTGHIPHGCANAIYLPYVIKYNAHEPEAMRRYADIARRVGLGGTSEKAQVNALIAKIEEFNRAMNIPKTIQEFGVKEDEFLEKLDSIAENAVGDACTGSNPRAITPEQMAKLFKCTFYGTEVDF